MLHFEKQSGDTLIFGLWWSDVNGDNERFKRRLRVYIYYMIWKLMW